MGQREHLDGVSLGKNALPPLASGDGMKGITGLLRVAYRQARAARKRSGSWPPPHPRAFYPRARRAGTGPGAAAMLSLIPPSLPGRLLAHPNFDRWRWRLLAGRAVGLLLGHGTRIKSGAPAPIRGIPETGRVGPGPRGAPCSPTLKPNARPQRGVPRPKGRLSGRWRT